MHVNIVVSQHLFPFLGEIKKQKNQKKPKKKTKTNKQNKQGKNEQKILGPIQRGGQ